MHGNLLHLTNSARILHFRLKGHVGTALRDYRVTCITHALRRCIMASCDDPHIHMWWSSRYWVAFEIVGGLRDSLGKSVSPPRLTHIRSSFFSFKMANPSLILPKSVLGTSPTRSRVTEDGLGLSLSMASDLY